MSAYVLPSASRSWIPAAREGFYDTTPHNTIRNVWTSPIDHHRVFSSPADAQRFGLADGEVVRVVSRRGAIETPIRFDPTLRPGLTFMTFHFQDDVATNIITIDATDPKSGTAEFKAAAIRIEKLSEPVIG